MSFQFTRFFFVCIPYISSLFFLAPSYNGEGHIQIRTHGRTQNRIPPCIFPYFVCLLTIFGSDSFVKVVTQIRGHIAGSSPPSRLLVRYEHVPCILFAGRAQPFLPSSTRVELCLPTPGALDCWCLAMNKPRPVRRIEPATSTTAAVFEVNRS